MLMEEIVQSCSDQGLACFSTADNFRSAVRKAEVDQALWDAWVAAEHLVEESAFAKAITGVSTDDTNTIRKRGQSFATALTTTITDGLHYIPLLGSALTGGPKMYVLVPAVKAIASKVLSKLGTRSVFNGVFVAEDWISELEAMGVRCPEQVTQYLHLRSHKVCSIAALGHNGVAYLTNLETKRNSLIGLAVKILHFKATACMLEEAIAAWNEELHTLGRLVRAAPMKDVGIRLCRIDELRAALEANDEHMQYLDDMRRRYAEDNDISEMGLLRGMEAWEKRFPGPHPLCPPRKAEEAMKAPQGNGMGGASSRSLFALSFYSNNTSALGSAAGALGAVDFDAHLDVSKDLQSRRK